MYTGAADFEGTSSKATTELVNQAATAIVVVPQPVMKGKKVLTGVELTVNIEPAASGGGVPTGQVIFELVTKRGKKTHTKTLGTAALNSGAATLTFKPNAVLNQKLTVIYNGDPDFLANTMNLPKLTRTGIAKGHATAHIGRR
jgi:hypothetical protein